MDKLKEQLREFCNDIRGIAVKIQPQFILECSKLYDLCGSVEALLAKTESPAPEGDAPAKPCGFKMMASWVPDNQSLFCNRPKGHDGEHSFTIWMDAWPASAPAEAIAARIEKGEMK